MPPRGADGVGPLPDLCTSSPCQAWSPRRSSAQGVAQPKSGEGGRLSPAKVGGVPGEPGGGGRTLPRQSRGRTPAQPRQGGAPPPAKVGRVPGETGEGRRLSPARSDREVGGVPGEAGGGGVSPPPGRT